LTRPRDLSAFHTSWVAAPVIRTFVCLRAHSALKQTLDFETAPGTAGATTQGGEHCLPRQKPGWKRPHATLKAVGLSPLFSRQPEYTADRPAFPLPGGPQGKPCQPRRTLRTSAWNANAAAWSGDRTVCPTRRIPLRSDFCARRGRAQGRCGTGGARVLQEPRVARFGGPWVQFRDSPLCA